MTYQDLYVQDERYFAIEHMDVRREVSRRLHLSLACPDRSYPHTGAPPRKLMNSIAC